MPGNDNSLAAMDVRRPGYVKYGDIYIPEELIEAQKDNKLVVFAGAGVSTAVPTKLPLLRSLAETLYKRYRNAFSMDFEEALQVGAIPEILDFLEANVRSKDLVRNQVWQTFAEPREPSVLHECLVRLFTTKQQLKIVTTNYDTLFSLSASRFRGPVSAQAYPDLGSARDEVVAAHPSGPDKSMKLAGIAYVHGNVESNVEDLVLTKSDILRAYMKAPAPAREFLQEVLQGQCVLFVGYGGTDYLVKDFIEANCKNSQPKWYALCSENEVTHWDSMWVTPVPYKIRRDDNHSDLYAALTDWAQAVQADRVLTKELEQILENLQTVPYCGTDGEDQSETR